MMFCWVFIVLFFCGFSVECARILAVFPSPGYSQYFVGEPLLLHLAERGHEITLISFRKPKKPVKNINAIEVEGLKPFLEERNVVELFTYNMFVTIRNTFYDYHIISTEKILKDVKVQRLIDSSVTFDLVLLEHTANEPLMAFAYHFKAPLILFSAVGATDWINHLVANPAPFSYVPHTFAKFATKMNIWQRALNFLAHTYSLYVKYFVLLPEYEVTVKKYFPNAPSMEEIMYNASIVLLNSHPAVTPPYVTTANMIEIGGFHIREETLSEDVQTFLDNSTNGVIYFSLGSNIDLRHLGDDKVEEVLDVFAGLKENVVWKFADEKLPRVLDNVLIQKWVSQRAMLNNTKVKAFISHCGLISTLEATYFGVPLICIPVFVDQGMNAALATERGVAITIHPQELNRDTLREALHNILTDKTFTENAKQRSKYFKDTPIDPMDLATYWIEFVIRHKGTPHLRNPGLNLRWYQYYFLDVLFLLVSILFVMYVFLFYIKKRVIRGKNKEKQQ